MVLSVLLIMSLVKAYMPEILNIIKKIIYLYNSKLDFVPNRGVNEGEYRESCFDRVYDKFYSVDDAIKIQARLNIYEKEKVAGGILTYGIPDFRLPKEVVRRETKNIEDLGVTMFDFYIYLKHPERFSLTNFEEYACIRIIFCHSAYSVAFIRSSLPAPCWKPVLLLIVT